MKSKLIPLESFRSNKYKARKHDLANFNEEDINLSAPAVSQNISLYWLFLFV